MVQHKIGVPMINVKNRTKYDLQNKMRVHFTHFHTSPKIPKKGQKFQSRDKIPKSESTVGWGRKTFSLQINGFVIDNIEMQLIRHIALFHAIKENRAKLK